MELYVTGEIDALKIVFCRILSESITPLPLICMNAFTIRTWNIESIERTLFCALWSSIRSFQCIGLDDVTIPVENAFNSIKISVCSDMKDIWDSTRKIQKNWRQVITNPEYVMCRRRLLYEFREYNL